MTKNDIIKNLNAQLDKAIINRDKAFRAGNFQTANKWIKKIVQLRVLIEQN